MGMHYDDHVYHMHYKLRAILISLHDASHIDLQQLCAWFLSLDNLQTETTPGVFLAMKHIYMGLFTAISLSVI